jgi:hypothetical protein
MRNNNLKYMFLLLFPLLILVFVVVTNINRNSINSDNASISVIPSSKQNITFNGTQIVSQLVSYNDTTKTLSVDKFNIVSDACDVKTVACLGYKLINKANFDIKISNKVKFLINNNSLTECVYGQAGFDKASLDFDQFRQLKCNFIGSSQLFLLEFLSDGGFTFTEYNVPTP